MKKSTFAYAKNLPFGNVPSVLIGIAKNTRKAVLARLPTSEMQNEN